MTQGDCSLKEIVGACGGGHQTGLQANTPQTAGLLHEAAYSKGPSCNSMEMTVNLVFFFEASQPNGAVYRVAMGWTFHPMASWVTAIARLF